MEWSEESAHIHNEGWACRAFRWFCDNAEAVVRIEASPIQLGDPNPHTLLHLLRPDLLPSRRDIGSPAKAHTYTSAATTVLA